MNLHLNISGLMLDLEDEREEKLGNEKKGGNYRCVTGCERMEENFEVSDV